MESITAFIKAFCEKIWFWLIVSVSSLLALFSEEIFMWLGFEAKNRWMVGITAILALSLAIQCICDLYREYSYRKRMIKRIDNFPKDEENLLKEFVAKNKQTFHVKNDRERDARIVSHFELKSDEREYVTIPDYLWKELKRRFSEKTNRYSATETPPTPNWAKKIFCNKITWIVIAICIVTINPRAIITQYISENWYLWSMLIFAAFLVWVIFKASHNYKKISIEDIVYMGAIYSLGLFVCLSSPISNSYPEKDIQRLFDCLTAFGPLIVGFVTAFFACTQWKVTEKQQNLALLEKRLSLKNKFENYVNNKLKESLEPKLNPEALRDTFSDLTNISGDAYLLFSKDISESIMQLAKQFEDLKTAVYYTRDKNQGKSLAFYEATGSDFEKDISKVYAKISYDKAVLINEMHLIMREGKI